MPPKTTRGGGTTRGTRGRGRGRGRGGAAQPPPADDATPANPSSQADDPFANPLSNSSETVSGQATEPADSALPPAARQPAQRLASLNRPSRGGAQVVLPSAGSSSSAPSSSANAAAAAPARGAPAGRAKFKPKAVRRAQEELKREEDEKNQRDLERNREADRDARFEARLRGHDRGRGRGRGTSTRGGSLSSSGIFGVLPASIKRDRAGGHGGATFGGSGGGGGGSGVKREGEGGDDTDDERGDRKNIEDIMEVSDDDDLVITASRKAKGNSQKGLRPIRIPRYERKKPTKVKTEPGVKAELPAESDDDVVMTDAAPAAPQFRMPSSSPKVKAEPDSSPELKFKPSPSRKKYGDISLPPAAQEPLAPTQAKIAARAKNRNLGVDSDDEEGTRIIEDMQALSNELLALPQAVPKAGGDADGEQDDGKIFLWQFPCYLPPLNNPDNPLIKQEEKEDAPASVKIKKEGEVKKTVNHIDLTRASRPEDEFIQPEGQQGTAVPKIPTVDEQGYFGKLTVRKSGKVVMTWGQNDFEIILGSRPQYPVMGVVVDEEVKNSEDAVIMPAYGNGMGPVVAKFCARIDAEKLFS